MGEILQIDETIKTFNIQDKLAQILRRQELADAEFNKTFPEAFDNGYCGNYFMCDNAGLITMMVRENYGKVPVYRTCHKFKHNNCYWFKAQRLTDWKNAIDFLNSTHKVNLDNLLPEDDWKNTTYLECAKDYLHRHHPNNFGLVLLGDMRVGKTSAAAWLAINLVMKYGYTKTTESGKTVYPVLWMRSGVLAAMLTGTFEKKDRARELLDAAKVLIIDDLGTERGQVKSQLDNYLSQLFFIVDEFYGVGKYLIATSNLGFKGENSPDFDAAGKEIVYLDTIYGARIIKRIKEKCIVFADSEAKEVV